MTMVVAVHFEVHVNNTVDKKFVIRQHFVWTSREKKRRTRLAGQGHHDRLPSARKPYLQARVLVLALTSFPRRAGAGIRCQRRGSGRKRLAVP